MKREKESYWDRMDRIAVDRAKRGRTAKARAAIYSEWFVAPHACSLITHLQVQHLLDTTRGTR